MAVDKRQGEAHYKNGGMEPIEYIEANKLPFAEGCIVKYATRHEYKDSAEEAIKDLYDIAIYAYLILKHRYQTGPMLDGRVIPTVKNAVPPGVGIWELKKDGELTLEREGPRSVSVEVPNIPVAEAENRNYPTVEQFNHLHQLLANRFPNAEPASFRQIVVAAIKEIEALREHTSIKFDNGLWQPFNFAKIPAEAIRRRVHVMLANGEVQFGEAEVFMWDHRELPEGEQAARRIVAWRIA